MEVQKIEGISPDMLWTFLIVLVGLAALLILGDKVLEVFRKARARRQEREQLNGQDITDRIAGKVMEKLTPKIDEKFDSFEKKVDQQFAEIDRKLASDKETLELHTAQLNAHKDRVDRLDYDSKALCHGVFALLSHEINGNNVEKLRKAHDAMRDYLIDGTYREEDWK